MTKEQFAQIEKPSELLRVALDDLRVVEKMPAYSINMETWHSPDSDSPPGSHCYVCIAGAVMVNTLNVGTNRAVLPMDFIDSISNKLYAINELRMGNIYQALHYMGISAPGVHLDRFMPYYEDVDFYQSFDQLICDLEDAGL